MPTETFRGVVQGGTVVLVGDSTSLVDGTEVVVLPVITGSAAAVIAAMETFPKVPTAWVDELDQLIASGQRAQSAFDPFNGSH